MTFDIMPNLTDTLEELANNQFFVKLIRLGAVRLWSAELYQGVDTKHPYGSSGEGFSPLEACHDALRIVREQQQ